MLVRNGEQSVYCIYMNIVITLSCKTRSYKNERTGKMGKEDALYLLRAFCHGSLFARISCFSLERFKSSKVNFHHFIEDGIELDYIFYG